jgi:AraC-like DNA-binding protein
MDTHRFYSKTRATLTFHDIGLGNHIQYLGRNNYAHAHKPLEVHDHGDAVEFAYLAKGRQVYNTNNKDYVLDAGDVFVAFPNEPHSTANWPEEKGILYWMIVKMPKAQEKFLDLPLNETRELKKRLLNLPRRVFSAPDTLAKLFDAVFLAYDQKPSSLRRIVLKSRLIELLTSLIEYSEHKKTPNACSQINAILSYIDSHLDKSLAIPDLAAKMKLSESWFKAKFLKNIGMSPAQYILSRKIDRAKTLLRAGNQSITQIAMSLGFSSSGYFATVFKRFTSQNPHDFLP